MTSETEDFELNGNLYLDIKEGSHDWYLAWGPLYLASHPAYPSLIDEYNLAGTVQVASVELDITPEELERYQRIQTEFITMQEELRSKEGQKNVQG